MGLAKALAWNSSCADESMAFLSELLTLQSSLMKAKMIASKAILAK